MTVTDREGSRTPIRGGDIIEGSDGPLGQLLEQAKALGAAAMETAQKMGQELSASLQTAASSPEAQQLGAELQRYGAEAARLSREGYEKFRREQLPRLKTGEAPREALEKAGKAASCRRTSSAGQGDRGLSLDQPIPARAGLPQETRPRPLVPQNSILLRGLSEFEDSVVHFVDLRGLPRRCPH
jgi:hypothetical protein